MNFLNSTKGAEILDVLKKGEMKNSYRPECRPFVAGQYFVLGYNSQKLVAKRKKTHVLEE
jgi:lipocalin